MHTEARLNAANHRPRAQTRTSDHQRESKECEAPRCTEGDHLEESKFQTGQTVKLFKDAPSTHTGGGIQIERPANKLINV